MFLLNRLKLFKSLFPALDESLESLVCTYVGSSAGRIATKKRSVSFLHIESYSLAYVSGFHMLRLV